MTFLRMQMYFSYQKRPSCVMNNQWKQRSKTFMPDSSLSTVQLRLSGLVRRPWLILMMLRTVKNKNLSFCCHNFHCRYIHVQVKLKEKKKRIKLPLFLSTLKCVLTSDANLTAFPPFSKRDKIAYLSRDKTDRVFLGDLILRSLFCGNIQPRVNVNRKISIPLSNN